MAATASTPAPTALPPRVVAAALVKVGLGADPVMVALEPGGGLMPPVVVALEEPVLLETAVALLATRTPPWTFAGWLMVPLKLLAPAA